MFRSLKINIIYINRY